MSRLALIHHDGRPVERKQPPTPNTEVEEPSLSQIAAREAEKQSTKNRQQGNDHV